MIIPVPDLSAFLSQWWSRCPSMLLAAALATVPAIGQTINVDVNSTSTASANYTGPGLVPGDTGTVWNALNVTNSTSPSVAISTVKDSLGNTLAGVSVTLAAASGNISRFSTTANSTPNPAALMQDYTFNGTYNITVAGLTPGTYKFWYFGHGDQANQAGTVTIDAANGGGTGSTANSALGRDLINGGEGISYVSLANKTVGAGGAFTFQVANFLNGFQLQRVISGPAELRPSIFADAGATAYTGTAVASVTGSTWNQLPGSASPLYTISNVLNATGTSLSGVNLTVASSASQISNYAANTPGNPNPLNLMRDYFFGANFTLSLSGLPQGSYLLYIFAHGDQANQNSTVTVAAANGGGSGATSATGVDNRDLFAPNAEGYSYLKFTTNVGAAGTLSFMATGYFTGFQLIPDLTPVIVTQPPATATGVTGTSASLTVIATSPGTITYQWQKSADGGNTFANIDTAENLSAATATLSFSYVRMSDAGIYRVIASSAGGSATSQNSVFTVSPNPVPLFSLHPASQMVLAGETVTLNALASAPSGVSYQWFKGVDPINGATASSYSFVAALTDSGSTYKVTATNGFGTATSNTATLNVVTILPIPAFPGAEGPGSTASGGRRGDVYHVTTLDDDSAAPIPGSLRHGLSNVPAGGRTVVFDVGGTIQLRSSTPNAAGSTIWLRSGANYITVAGQTAPYPGITIIGQGTKLTGDNMIVRNLAFRPGPDRKSPGIATNDGLSLQTKNSIIDHVSAGFSDDEALSPTDAATNTTVQYSIIAEGLNYVLADGSAHAFGTLLSSEVADAPLSLHHNLYSDMSSRNPRVGNDGNGVVLGGANEGSINNISNNLVYDWKGRASYDVSGAPARANFLNNYFVAGPTTVATDRVFYGSGANTRIFHSGNMVDMNKNTSADGVPFNFSGAQFEGSIASVATPFAVPGGYLQTAAQAYDTVLNYAGTFWWNRSPLEARIVNEVRTNGGGIIKSAAAQPSIPGYEYPATTGGPIFQEPNGGAQVNIFDGLPLFPLTTRPAGFDIDGDGMPDAWETAHGLNPSAANSSDDFDGDGYTDLDEYINELAAFPAPKTLVFGAAGGRYEHWKNWDLNWQPSRYDSVRIENSTATLDSAGQSAGTLLVRGMDVTPELRITGGWLEVTNGLTIGGSGGTGKLTVTGGEIRGNVAVEAGGVLGGSAGQFTITGNLRNNGTVRLTQGSSLNVTGSFVNHGLLDIMTGSQNLPAGFLNLGTVLDSSLVRASSAARSGTSFTVTIQGYNGHVYQLLRSDSPNGPWQEIGAAQAGTGAPLVFTDPAASTASGFYRIAVSP